MVEKSNSVGQAPTTTTTQPQEKLFDEHKVVEKETISQFAANLSKKLGVKVTTEDIYRYNPQFDPSKADVHKKGGKFETARPTNPDGSPKEGTWDPDYLRPGDVIRLPTLAGVKSKEPYKPGTTGDAKPTDKMEPGKKKTDKTQPKTDPDKALNPKQVEKEKQKKEATDVEKPKEKKEDGMGKKILKFIDKIFRNPIFQGIMAILASIPGIGQVVSAIGALLGLTSVLGQWMTAKEGEKKFDIATLASTFFYLLGAIAPAAWALDGIGAFGGLIGMAITPPKEDPDEKKAQEKQKPIEAMPAEKVDSTIAEATKLLQSPTLFDDNDAFKRWEALAQQLRLEYHRLQQLGDKATAEDRERMKKIEVYFAAELSPKVLSRGASLAYNAQDPAPTTVPTAGRLFVATEDTTIDKVVASIKGAQAKPEQMNPALRAFNGLPEDAAIKKGMILYIPTDKQLELKPKAGWPGIVWMHQPDDDREYKMRVIQKKQVEAAARWLGGMPGDLPAQARQIIERLKKMAVVKPQEYQTNPSPPPGKQDNPQQPTA